MKKITTLILAFLFLATGLFAQKATTVGVVDVSLVLADFTEFQAAIEKVRGSVAPVEEEMQRMQADIQAIITEIREVQTKADNPAASEAARAEAVARIGVLQVEGQEAQASQNQFRQQAQELARKGQEEQLAPLEAKVREAVKTVAEDKGIDLVAPKNQIMYSSEALDISDAVIAVLNSSE
jgi:Skp family chaperone for outer membrane proteins